MAYRSNLPAVRAELTAARRAGLIAAATVYQNAVKRALTGGYTSGAFVTGYVRASVAISEPEVPPNGPGRILIGTNVPYAAYWELGHVNLFLRKYVRVEKWWPAFIENAQAMRDAYTRTFRRFAGGP